MIINQTAQKHSHCYVQSGIRSELEGVTNFKLAFTEASALLEIDTGKLVFANGKRCEYKTEQCDTAEWQHLLKG